MKLSIWRQFSSNHSADFEVVGKFKTVDDARQAENILREIIQTIGDDYRKYFSSDIFWRLDKQKLSRIETTVKEKYQLNDWNRILDWTYLDFPDSTVKRFRDLVIVSNFTETWAGVQPFDQLMMKLADEIAFGVEMTNRAYLTLRCNAPNEEFAENIVTNANQTTVFDDGKETIHEYTVPNTDWRIWGHLSRDGVKLTFAEISVRIGTVADYQRDTVTILQHLVPYLESQGCTNIEYDLLSL